MTDDTDDRIFQRAAAELRAPGARDEAALDDVLAALRGGAASRFSSEDARDLRLEHEHTRFRRRSRRRGTVWLVAGLAAAVAFAAGIGVGGFAGWRLRGESYRVAMEDLGIGRVPPIVPATAATATLGIAQPVQFMLVAPTARRVALVGEFNDWDPGATPMARAPGGAWHVALPLTQGRHVYAFVVDGSAWVPDPQAPLAPERWFGSGNSVMLVSGGTTQ